MVTGDMATLTLAGTVQGCWLHKTTHVLRQKAHIFTHGGGDSWLIPGSDEPGIPHNMPEALDGGGRRWPLSSASHCQVWGLRLLAPVPTTGSDLWPSLGLASAIRDESALITKRPA